MAELMAFWMPTLAGGKVDASDFSARIRGSFTPKDSGLHRVGIFAAGYAKVYVYGHLIANACDGWIKDAAFFEDGCDDVVSEVNLDAVDTHDVVIEFCNKLAGNLVFAGSVWGSGGL